MAILHTQTTTYRGPTLMGYLLTIVTWQALFIGAFLMSGCGGSGGDSEPPPPNVFNTTNEDKPCGDVTLDLGSPEEVQEAVDDAVSDAIDAGEDPVVEDNPPVFDNSGALKYKKSFTVIAGCNNTVVNEVTTNIVHQAPQAS